MLCLQRSDCWALGLSYTLIDEGFPERQGLFNNSNYSYCGTSPNIRCQQWACLFSFSIFYRSWFSHNFRDNITTDVGRWDKNTYWSRLSGIKLVFFLLLALITNGSKLILLCIVTFRVQSRIFCTWITRFHLKRWWSSSVLRYVVRWKLTDISVVVSPFHQNFLLMEEVSTSETFHQFPLYHTWQNRVR